MLAVTLALCAGGGASAAGTPSDLAGTKLGIMQLNNSGQIGEVIVFAQGPKSLVHFTLQGAGKRSEAAALFRGADCDSLERGAAYRLSALSRGASTTQVAVPSTRLLSGNYNLVVYGNAASTGPAVACAHLYR